MNHLTKFLKDPRENDIVAFKRLCRYIKGTIDHGVKVPKPNGPEDTVTLDAYTDSDWDRRQSDEEVANQRTH